ncbi:hypothetical protein FEM03_12225 [Phragmitibacter flavus]|uniref:Phosphodiester glycosidase domain-containing protein n=2 Tax=Phragmitibacter flavus TaxID=2576071 RepID=A0A5R8KEB4_9BACT|nr:hypothetical protein FEM03_12225 [Phragmitibacter flavus]
MGVEYLEMMAAGKKVTVCKVDLRKEKLELFHRDDAGLPLKSFDGLGAWLEAKGRVLSFAMNAGMYHGDFSAVGLYVADGRQVVPLNLEDAEGNFFLKPNGVFLISDKGARVVESAEYLKVREKERVKLATQSGPLLLRAGILHPMFNLESKSRLFRNGVGVKSPHEVFFAISEEPVNFYEFATFFRDVLKCPDALFLDGTISSLYAPELKRNDKKMDLGPMIGIAVPGK